MDKDFVELLKQSQELITRLNDTIKDLVPIAEFGEKVIADERFYSMKDAADIITESVYDATRQRIGRTKLFANLREMGILCSSDSNWNDPYREFINNGCFYVKIKETSIGMKNVTLVTGKGLKYIQKKVIEWIAE